MHVLVHGMNLCDEFHVDDDAEKYYVHHLYLRLGHPSFYRSWRPRDLALQALAPSFRIIFKDL